MRQEDSGLLLYTVAGESYASPLEELREVVDVEWTEKGAVPIEDSPGAALVREHSVVLVAFEDVLGVERPDPAARIRPMLVVEASTMWIGLLVDSVHGMVPSERISHLPGGISEFPDELIIGMFLHRVEGSARVTAGSVDSGRTVDGWVDEHEESGDIPSAERPHDGTDSDAQMILVMDLAVLAEIASRSHGGE